MPRQHDVDETHTYWCPKWYWPFAICTRTTRVHKWCYQFRWVQETGWGLMKHWEGCEGETRYSWWTACLFCFGGQYHQYEGIEFFEMCFDKPLEAAGRCAG